MLGCSTWNTVVPGKTESVGANESERVRGFELALAAMVARTAARFNLERVGAQHVLYTTR